MYTNRDNGHQIRQSRSNVGSIQLITIFCLEFPLRSKQRPQPLAPAGRRLPPLRFSTISGVFPSYRWYLREGNNEAEPNWARRVGSYSRIAREAWTNVVPLPVTVSEFVTAWEAWQAPRLERRTKPARPSPSQEVRVLSCPVDVHWCLQRLSVQLRSLHKYEIIVSLSTTQKRIRLPAWTSACLLIEDALRMRFRWDRLHWRLFDSWSLPCALRLDGCRSWEPSSGFTV